MTPRVIIPQRHAPEDLIYLSSNERAQGKPGALSTHCRVHINAHGRLQVRRNTRLSLRDGFNGVTAEGRRALIRWLRIVGRVH